MTTSCSDDELRAAAIDLAVRRGGLQAPPASCGFRASSSGLSYVLVDTQGNPLARLPKAAVVSQVEKRRARLDHLIHRVSHQRIPTTHGRSAMRLRSWEERGLAWALSTHRPVPEPVFGSLQLVITALLLLLGIVPGLIYLAVLLQQRFRWQRAMENLLLQWTSLGRPDPVERAANEGPV